MQNYNFFPDVFTLKCAPLIFTNHFYIIFYSLVLCFYLLTKTIDNEIFRFWFDLLTIVNNLCENFVDKENLKCLVRMK